MKNNSYKTCFVAFHKRTYNLTVKKYAIRISLLNSTWHIMCNAVSIQAS